MLRTLVYSNLELVDLLKFGHLSMCEIASNPTLLERRNAVGKISRWIVERFNKKEHLAINFSRKFNSVNMNNAAARFSLEGAGSPNKSQGSEF